MRQAAGTERAAARGGADSGGDLLQVEDLRVWFPGTNGPIRAVDGVSLRVPAGGAVALVGESGSGKSATALALGRLYPEPRAYPYGGQVAFDGLDIFRLSARGMANLRGKGFAYVFQDPGAALNPVLRVGRQIEEVFRVHGVAGDAREATRRLLESVGLAEAGRVARAYPHELSGGMQQRVVLAMAAALAPRLLIADEPTTALDVTVQAQILELLKTLRAERGMAVLLITHNLGLVADFADWVYVMYAGRIVECGGVVEVLSRPGHPYTRGLLNAVPTLDRATGVAGGLAGMPGAPPDPAAPPPGCRFAPRCPCAEAHCRAAEPPLGARGPDHAVRCHLRATTDGKGRRGDGMA